MRQLRIVAELEDDLAKEVAKAIMEAAGEGEGQILELVVCEVEPEPEPQS